MKDFGIIRRSNLPWSSPLLITPKPGGGWRQYGDFRCRNVATIDDHYPIPHIGDFKENLQGKTIFSKIDLARKYHQIPMVESNICKTATITPCGLWEFLGKPFGLKNAAQTFHGLMETILRGIPCIFIYLVDILVSSSTQTEHREHLSQVFKVLSLSSMLVKRQKCVFGAAEIDFVGHHVNTSGIKSLAESVSTVHEFPVPNTKKSLQIILE